MTESVNHFFKSELTFPPTSESGAEKDVYKLTFAGHVCAAKIYKNPYQVNGEWINLDRKELVRKEAAAYAEWKSDPALAPYIPELLGTIVDENNEEVGLMLEWKEGPILGQGLDHTKFPATVFDRFERALHNTQVAHFPDLDTLDANLGIDKQSPVIFWFAECSVDEDATRADYEKTITAAVNKLRHYYQAKT